MYTSHLFVLVIIKLLYSDMMTHGHFDSHPILNDSLKTCLILIVNLHFSRMSDDISLESYLSPSLIVFVLVKHTMVFTCQYFSSPFFTISLLLIKRGLPIDKKGNYNY